jgi:WD40 repeat protein/serine/threonine protein kinase
MNQSAPDLKAVFGQALELPSVAERARYLAEACGDDPALRAEVESLLRAFDRAGSFLEPPVALTTATLDAPSPAEHPGTVIGPYKLLQPIGEGGMGTVYMAEQAWPVQRRVALKVIKVGLDSRQVLARFEAERQALALMDHPNIAKVLEAGTTDDGRPYFVMELVKGVPITQFCDERRLTPRERLELFLPVCHAVQHAHQKGVIHRDLKPSNVLIALYDGVPMPKVIDFGVAKATGPKLTERTLFTEFGSVVGTPQYMSPEQAELNQLDVDTRSDIYSLGVLLYELLTGTTPLDPKRLKQAALLEVLRMIREEEPPRPSTRLGTTEELPSIAERRGLEPKRLSGLVRGELDWIVMKALEKDRNRRYETANSLALDLRRYLDDEPVQACPPSPLYRFAKFGRRHRVTVVALAVVATALVLGTAVTTWEAFRATRAEHRLAAAFQDADAQRGLASKRADDLDRQLYINRVNLAYREWSVANVALADRLLEDCPLIHHGWEWQFVRRLCHLAERTDQNSEMVHALAVSPRRQLAATGGGPWLASPEPRGELVLRDAATGQERFARRGLRGFISGLAFSPDGDRLAAVASAGLGNAGSPKGEWTLWNVQTGEWFTHPEQDMAGFSVAFSPDGRWVATGLGSEEAGSGLVRIWDVLSDEPKCVASLTDPDRPGPVFGVAFSPEGRRIAAASPGQVRIWTGLANVWSPGQALRVPSGHVSAVAFRPDGEQLATAHWDNTVRLWDLKTSRELRTLFSHTGFVRCLAYSPDGHHLASGGEDNNMYLWDIETGRPETTLHGHESFVTALAFHSDGRLVSGSLDRGVKTWDLVSSRPLVFRKHGGHVYSLEFNPDGTRVLSAGADKTARIWDAMTGRELRSYRGHQHIVALARFRPNGRDVVSFDQHGTVRFWDSTDGRDIEDPLVTSSYTYSWGNDVALRPDGLEIAVRAPGGTIQLWDLTKRRVIHTLSGHTGKVVGLAYSFDGDRLFSTSALGDPSLIDAQPGGELKLWDVTTGRELATLRRGIGVFRRLAVSPDGRRLAVSGGVLEAGETQVWDAETGETLLTLHGHALGVHQVTFSPRGERIATAGADRMVRLWDAATGQELLTLGGHNAGVICLAFSPDGHQLASGSIDWTARIWDGRPLGLEASSNSPGRNQ